MKRRRKFLALLMAVCLLIFYTVPAYADGIEGNATETTGSQTEADPTVTDPADPEEPAEVNPTVEDPAVTDPADPEAPDGTDPAVVDPAATDPETPDGTDPAVTDPETPDGTDPTVTDPADPDAPVDPADPEAGLEEGEEGEETEETEGENILLEGAPEEILRAFTASPQIPDTVKIISYNMLTTSKRGLQYDYVSPSTGILTPIDRTATFESIMAQYMPDSFGACEVTNDWKNYLVNYCNNSNGLYAIAGLTSSSGKTLTSGSGEYSPVIYRSDRYDLAGEGGWWFSPDPDSKVKFEISGHQPYNGSSMNFTRVFSFAVLKYKGTDDIAYIHISAHTDHQSDDYVNVLCSRLLKEKADYLRSIYGDVPVVISGDHNCTEFTYSYRYLADSVNGFADAKYLSDVRSNLSTAAGFEEDYSQSVNVNNTIDHIYISTGNVGAVYSDVLENPYFSDHCGIISELVLGSDKYPVITGVGTSDAGARAIDIDNGLATRKLSFETGNSTLTLSVNTNGSLFLNGAAVDPTFSLNLQNGANEFSLVTVLNNARTEYKLTVYKTTGEVFPVATEVYPGGNDSFIDITNLGGSTMDLADYEIFYGSRKLELSCGSKQIMPGETFIILGSSGATAESFNNAYTKGLYASEVSEVTGAGIADNSEGVVTIKKNGQVISRSDFSAFGPASLSGKTYKFAIYNGAVTSGLFPYDRNHATPGVYENDLGITVKSAYDTIIAGRADILGGDAFNEADRIASETLGSFAYYTNIDFGEGSVKSVKFNASVKGSNGGGRIELYIDGGYDGSVSDLDPIATVLMTETHPTAWTVFKDFTANLKKKVTGIHNLTLIFIPDTGKSYASNLATITFSDEEVEEPVVKEEYDPSTARVTVECESATTVTPGVTYKGEEKTPNVQKSNTILGTTVNGSTAVYKGVRFGDTGLKDFWFNLAIKNSNTQGIAHVYLYDNETKGEEIAYLRVLSTDGPTNDWNTYKDLEGTLLKKDITGTHDLIVEFEVDDKFLYVGNLDRFWFGKDLRDPYEKIEAETFDHKTGAKTAIDGTYTGNVSGLKSDSTITYRNVNFKEGNFTGLTFFAAMNADNNGGSAEMFIIDGDSEIKIASVNFVAEAGQTYKTVKEYAASLEEAEVVGIHDVVIKTTLGKNLKGGDAKWVCQIDGFKFVKGEEPVPPEPEKTERNYTPADPNYIYAEGEWSEDFTEGETTDGKHSVMAPNLQTAAGATGYTYEGKNILGNAVNGSSVTIKDIDFGDTGIYTFDIYMAIKTTNCEGSAHVFLFDEGKKGTEIADCTVLHTTGIANNYNDYQMIEGRVLEQSVTGTHDLLIEFEVAEGYKYIGNMDYFRFGKCEATEPIVITDKKYTDTYGYLPYMHEAPKSLRAGEDFIVTLKYDPLTEGTAVYLNYNKRTSGQDFTRVEMVKKNDNFYEATIPGSAITAEGGLTYYFEEEGALQYTDVIYTNGVSGYAFKMSDMYYVPIVSDNTPEYPEIIITELNAQDKKGNAMEYVVLHNTTDRRLNLRDYTLKRYWYLKGYGNAYTFADSAPIYIEADRSLVLWKNTGSYSLEDLNTYYYGSALTAADVVLVKGDQFPTATGYGLTLFKGNKEICSVMWRYTDTYCTDGNVKFAPVCKNATALGIIDNSTDNEAVNFRGISDRSAVEDAARIFDFKDIDVSDLPSMTAHGVRVSWSQTEKGLKALFTRGNESTEKTFRVTADGAHTPTIFVVGDSITQFYKMPDYPRDGWGAELNRFVAGNAVRIRNFGKSGRSTNTFFAEKNFYDMLEEVKPGDAVLIQLCTNDCGSSAGVGVSRDHYQILLGYMFAAILEKGATPVMVESACTHPQTEGGFGDQPEIREYNTLAHEVAELYRVPSISLYDITKNLMQTEGYEGMKDIMQYADANDLRYLDDPAFYTYTDTFLKESKTDKFHYSRYGSEILAKAVMSGVKEKLPAFAEGIDLSYEPVRKYYRTLSFNGTAASRDSYGAEYDGQVTVEFDLGVAPSGTVTIDGTPVTSGSTYKKDGSHVLRIFIDDNNVNEIPFTIRNGEKTVTENTSSTPAAGTGNVANNEQGNEVQNMQTGNTPAASETPGRIAEGTTDRDGGDTTVNNEPAVTETETENNTEVIKDEDTALSEKPAITEETGTSETIAETSEITDNETPLAAEAEKEGLNIFLTVVAIVAILAILGAVSVNLIKARKIK